MSVITGMSQKKRGVPFGEKNEYASQELVNWIKGVKRVFVWALENENGKVVLSVLNYKVNSLPNWDIPQNP